MADVTVTFKVKEQYVDDLLEAFELQFPGRETSGMTKPQWAQYQIRQFVREVYRACRARQIVQVAQQQAASAPDLELT